MLFSRTGPQSEETHLPLNFPLLQQEEQQPEKLLIIPFQSGLLITPEVAYLELSIQEVWGGGDMMM